LKAEQILILNIIKRSNKILVLLFLLSGFSFGQKNITDSLKNLLNTAKHDTIRIKMLSKLTDAEQNDTIWPKYNAQIKVICEKNLADLKENEAGYAILHRKYLEYLSIYYNNQGLLYRAKGDIPKTLDYLNKGLKILEEINIKEGIAMAFNNIGAVYFELDDLNKADEYYQKSLKLQEETHDEYGMGVTYNSIGVVYKKRGDSKKALEYYLKALAIFEKMGDKVVIAQFLNNIGFIYDDENKFDEALKYYEQSLKIRIEIEDIEGQIESYCNTGYIYYKQKKYDKAITYYEKAMDLAKKQGFPENIRDAALRFYEVFKAQNKSAKALEMHELFILMRDSIDNDKARTAGIKQLLQYDFEKKALADSIRVVEEKKVTALQLDHEKTQRYALYGGLVLVLVFAVVMFNRFKYSQRQNAVIEHQKHIVEEKQREILDSIEYAKRIQNSLLPSDKKIDKDLNRLNRM
jgi:tetratricopeptide (TPR) repeat protein